ncbi:unnamed protein product [Ixodes hexagonus]
MVLFPLFSDDQLWEPIRMLDWIGDGDPTRYCDRRERLRQRKRPSSELHAERSSKLELTCNVRGFQPEELSVRTVDRNVVVYGKHEETHEDGGFVRREFTRRFPLPEDIDPETVTSSLDTETGRLLIEAPRTSTKKVKTVPVVVEEAPAVEDKADS